MANFLLCLLLITFALGTLAVPQGIITVTKSKVDSRAIGSSLEDRQITPRCLNTCTRYEDRAIEYTWIPITINTTIVAATVFVSVDMIAGTTSRSTSLLPLPSGYTRPPTNAEGTHIESLFVPVGTTSKFTTL